MTEVEVFGIVLFRSSWHLAWFLITIGGLGTFLVGYRAAVLKVRYRRAFLHAAFRFGIHVGMTIAAGIITEGGEITTPAWSFDCIWFNALLSGFYMGLGIGVVEPWMSSQRDDKNQST